MFKNYLKLAWKVLGRNKFFTGISLFGISFTLMILMLITAMTESQLGPNRPMTHKDRMVMLPRLTMKLIEPDTTWLMDSTEVGGKMVYDSTMQVVDNNSSTSISGLGYYYIDNYLRDAEPKSDYTVVSGFPSSFDIFLSNEKLTVDAVYADAGYWDVFDFTFIEGNPFNVGHVENATPVAVITDRTARRIFGSTTGAVGQEIELGNRKHEVVGVVARSVASHRLTAVDVFLPYTTVEGDALTSRDYLGPFTVAYLAPTPQQVPELKADIIQQGLSAPLPNPEEYNTLEVEPVDYLEAYVTGFFNQGGPEKSVMILQLVFGGLLLFFILLPTLNLINLNVSRIMEREAEIGVRKAFGAHSGNILYQFVFENVILTLIGGAIGLILAVALIFIINDSQVFPDTILQFNARVFIYSLFICLAFGVLSGVLPAWRMSRLHIANALKSNQL